MEQKKLKIKKENTINYKPMNKTFLVKMKETTESGIILDKAVMASIGSEIKELEWDEVVMISEDCEYVKVGDRVVVGPYTKPIAFKIDGVPYAQVGENAIIGFRL